MQNTQARNGPDLQPVSAKAFLLIAAVTAAVIGLIFIGAAEHRQRSANVIASAEFRECEAYLSRNTTAAATKTKIIQYCHDLHYGRVPRPELTALMAAAHNSPLAEAEFRERYLTPGRSRIPAANRPEE